MFSLIDMYIPTTTNHHPLEPPTPVTIISSGQAPTTHTATTIPRHLSPVLVFFRDSTTLSNLKNK